MKNPKTTLIESALHLAEETKSDCVFLFLHTLQNCNWFLKTDLPEYANLVVVLPKDLKIKDSSFKKKI